MFNQKNVDGNKAIVAGNESGHKLFRAYSIVDDFENLGRIRINWFCLGREEPIGPYEQLIEGYENGNSTQELGVNEYFTGNEIDMLRGYLKRLPSYGDFRSIEMILPVPGDIMPYCLQDCGCYGLCLMEDNDLPFKVGGYGRQI